MQTRGEGGSRSGGRNSHLTICGIAADRRRYSRQCADECRRRSRPAHAATDLGEMHANITRSVLEAMANPTTSSWRPRTGNGDPTVGGQKGHEDSRGSMVAPSFRSPAPTSVTCPRR